MHFAFRVLALRVYRRWDAADNRRRRVHRLQPRSATRSTTPSDRVVVVDKLTYAGSLLNLEDAARSDPRVTFVRGGHRRSRRDGARLRRASARTPSSTSPPRRTSIGRSTVRGRSSTPTSSARSCCSKSRAHIRRRRSTRRARDAFRFLHVSTDEVYGTLGAQRAVQRGDAVRAEFAVRGEQGVGRSSGARRISTPTACRSLITNCSNNYGPFQFPEKLIPLMILNAHRRPPAADLRRRRQRARLAARRGSLRGHSAGAREGAVGREVQHRRRQRADEPRDRRSHLRHRSTSCVRPPRRAGAR